MPATTIKNEEAAASLRAETMPRLDSAYNFARFLSRDADAADEIVERALLRIRTRPGGARSGDFHALLLKTVRDCYHDRLVKRRGAGMPAGNTAAAFDDIPGAVTMIIAALARPLREVLVLREFEKLSYRQIAQITSRPISTVVSRLARARVQFRDAWRADVDRAA